MARCPLNVGARMELESLITGCPFHISIFLRRYMLHFKIHARQFLLNLARHGYLVAVMGSTWLLKGLDDCYGVTSSSSIFMNIALRGSYGTFFFK